MGVSPKMRVLADLQGVFIQTLLEEAGNYLAPCSGVLNRIGHAGSRQRAHEIVQIKGSGLDVEADGAKCAHESL